MPLFQNATYAASVATLDDPLPESAGEIAFAGRSNAGKSSAINTLATRRRLAFVSKLPGRTQMINFFALGEMRFLVDLPGYGYASVPGSIRSKWDKVLGNYLQGRPELRGMALMMDIRHPMTELDQRMIEFMQPTGIPIHVLVTKSDKLARTEAIARLKTVREALALLSPNYSAQLFSSLKRSGIEEAEAVFAGWLSMPQSKTTARGKLAGVEPGSASPIKKPVNTSGRIRRRTDGIWKPKNKSPQAKGE
jgi:GTP-binding protein